MKLVKMMLLSFLCLALCFGCGKKEEENQEVPAIQADDTQKETEDTRTDNEIISDAMKKTSKLAAFEADTEGSLKLGGKSISGEFGMKSQIHVVQGENPQDLQMTMETQVNPGDMTSRAYYKDGWYYVDDGEHREKLQQSPEEVLGIITDITNMVADASDKIENINVQEDGTDRIYSYVLPAYIVEDYIRTLMADMGADDAILEEASTEIENLGFVSTVNAEGILIKQEIWAAGSLKRAIVTVPVEAKLTAEFAETEERELMMELW